MSSTVYHQGDKLVIRFSRSSLTVAAGVALVLAGVSMIWRPTLPGEIDTPFWDLAGGMMLLVGTVIALFRCGAVVDRSTDTLARWTGFVIPMVSTIPLFRRNMRITPRYIRLANECYCYRGQKTNWYPITLVGEARSVTLGRPEAIMQAWSIAQALATHLGVDLSDETEHVTALC